MTALTVEDRSEHYEQVDVVRYLTWLGVAFFAVPNAAKRGPRLAAFLKAEGLSPGVPDLILPLHCVAIEMKAVDGAKPTPAQEAWLARLEAGGWRTRVCYGSDNAIAWLKEIGVPDDPHATRTARACV